MKDGFVYIMASISKRLYTGVTAELAIRVKQHKNKTNPNSHTARYNIDRLVYYEHFGDIREAINREASIKNMHRVQKIQLIVATNHLWRDLSEDFGKQAAPFHETKMLPRQTF